MSRRNSRRSCAGRLIRLFVVALVVLGAIGWWVAIQLRPAATLYRPVVITIPPGAGAAKIASILQSQGLIRNEQVFLWYASLSRKSDMARLRAGEYRLSPDMTPGQIIDKLVGGEHDLTERRITIPEGYTAKQIAEALEKKRLVTSADAFLKEIHDKTIQPDFDIPASGLEGYLFPETYEIPVGADPHKIAEMMVGQFQKRFYDDNRDAIRSSGHSLHEIVTIGSLIEREAEVEKDRPLIAGVIENRLKKGMRLQIDAALDYALGYHKNHLYYRDLKVESPYNTYRHKGLPPGPIANPGLPSLLAALHPAHHDFLYYVAGPNREHVFTRTEAEHNHAKAAAHAQR